MDKVFFLILTIISISCAGQSAKVNEIQNKLNDLGKGLIKIFETDEIALRKEGLSLDLKEVNKGDLIIEISNSPKVDDSNKAAYVDSILNYLWAETDFIDSNLSSLIVKFFYSKNRVIEGLPVANELEVELDWIYGALANTFLFSKQDTLTAIELYDKALEINPNNVVLIYNIAVLKYSVGNMIGAKKDAELVLQKMPNKFEVLFFLGMVNKDLKNYRHAIRYYNTCLGIDSTSTMVLGDVARCFLRLKKYNDALYYYEKALDINSNLDFLKPEKAFSLLKLGKEDEFKNYVNNDWAEIDNNNAKLLLNWKLVKVGDIDSACIMFNDNNYKNIDKMYSNFLKDISKVCK